LVALFLLEPEAGDGLDGRHEEGIPQFDADEAAHVAEQAEQGPLLRHGPIFERAGIHGGALAGTVRGVQVLHQTADGAAQCQFLDRVGPELLHRVPQAARPVLQLHAARGHEGEDAVPTVEIDA